MKHNGSIYDYAIHKDDIGVYTTLFYVILSQVILPEAKSRIESGESICHG